MNTKDSITEYLREHGRVFFSFAFASNLLVALGITINIYLLTTIISYVIPIQKIAYYFIIFSNCGIFIPLLFFNLYKDWYWETIRDIDIKNSIETYFQVYAENRQKAEFIKKQVSLHLYSKQNKVRYKLPREVLILVILLVICIVISLLVSYIAFNKSFIAYVNPEQRSSLLYKKLLDSKFEALGIESNKEMYDINQQYDAISKQLQKGEINQDEFQAYIDSLLEHLDKNADIAKNNKTEITKMNESENNEKLNDKGMAPAVLGSKTNPSFDKIKDFLKNKLKRDDVESENTTSTGVGKTNTGKSLIDSPLKDFKSYVTQIFSKGDKGKVKSSESFSEEQKQALFSLYFSDYVENFPLVEYIDPAIEKILQSYMEYVDEFVKK